jgi:hypothetical protein
MLRCVLCSGSWCGQITGRVNIDVELKLQTTGILAPNGLTKLATQIYSCHLGSRDKRHLT